MFVYGFLAGFFSFGFISASVSLWVYKHPKMLYRGMVNTAKKKAAKVAKRAG